MTAQGNISLMEKALQARTFRSRPEEPAGSGDKQQKRG
jgi:hypothetical protein